MTAHLQLVPALTSEQERTASMRRHPAGRALRPVHDPLPPHLNPRAVPPSTRRNRIALAALVLLVCVAWALATRGQVPTWHGLVPDGVLTSGVPA